VSNISLLWTANALCHAPWVHLSIDFPTHWGISAPSSNHVRVRLIIRSIPVHLQESSSSQGGVTHMYNMYLSVPLPAMTGWISYSSECWRTRRSNHPKLKPRTFIQHWPFRGKSQSHNILMANLYGAMSFTNTVNSWFDDGTIKKTPSPNYQKPRTHKLTAENLFKIVVTQI
jgi:hypothetical protein